MLAMGINKARPPRSDGFQPSLPSPKSKEEPTERTEATENPERTAAEGQTTKNQERKIHPEQGADARESNEALEIDRHRGLVGGGAL